MPDGPYAEKFPDREIQVEPMRCRKLRQIEGERYLIRSISDAYPNREVTVYSTPNRFLVPIF